MPFRINGRASLMGFAVIASATALGTGMLLFERVQGTDMSKDFKEDAANFSLLVIKKNVKKDVDK